MAFAGSEVGNLFVSIGADVDNFSRGMQNVESQMQRTAGNVQSHSSRMSSALGSFTQTALGMAAGMGVFAALGGAVDLVKTSIIGFNASMEQSKIGWTTLLKSGENAEAMLYDLSKLAATTPFEFEDVERGAKRLLAMGFAAKDVKPLLIDVGNAASAMGLGATGIDRVTLALGQMNAKTKVQAGEMLQLTEAGIPAWEMLAGAMGKSTAEVMKMSEKGEIASKVFIDAFQEFSRQNYGDAMEKQSKTFNGAISTISDSVKIVASTAFQPFFNVLSDLAQRIAAFVSSEDFQIWGGRVQAVVSVVIDGLGILARGFADGLGAVLDIVIGVGQAIYEALQWLNPFAAHSPPLVDQVEDGVGQIIDQYGEVESIRSPLERAGAAIERFGEAGKNAAKIGMTELKRAADGIKDSIDQLKDSMRAAEDDLRAWTGVDVEGSAAFKEQMQAIDLEMAQTQRRLNDMKLSMPKLVAPGVGASKEDRESYQRAREAQEAALRPLEDTLDRLRTQADNLRLDERIQLGPLRRQIDALTKPSVEKPFQDIVDGITGAQARIQEIAPELATAESAYDAMQGTIKELSASMSEQAAAAADTAKATKAAAGGFANVGTEIKDKLAGLDLSGPKEEMAKLKASFEETKEGVKKSIDGMLEPFRRLKTGLQEIGEYLAPGNERDLMGEWFGPDFGPRIDTVVRGIKTLVDRLKEFADTAPANAWKMLQDAAEELQSAWSNLAPTTERIANLMGTIKDAIGGLIPQPLGDFVGQIGELGGKAAEGQTPLQTLVDLINGLSEAIENATSFIRDNVGAQTILVGLLTMAATAWTLHTAAVIAHQIATKAVAAATAVYTGAQWLLNAALTANPIGVVIVALAGLAAGIMYAYNNSEDFRTAVDRAWQALQDFADGVGDAMGELGRFIEKLATADRDLRQWIADTAANALTEAARIGSNLIEGLKRGIDNAWQGLKDKIAAMGDIIPGWLKKALGIASPSTVFAEIGANMIKGLGTGLGDLSPTAQRFVDDFRNYLVRPVEEEGKHFANIWERLRDLGEREWSFAQRNNLDFLFNQLKAGKAGLEDFMGILENVFGGLRKVIDPFSQLINMLTGFVTGSFDEHLKEYARTMETLTADYEQQSYVIKRGMQDIEASYAGTLATLNDLIDQNEVMSQRAGDDIDALARAYEAERDQIELNIDALQARYDTERRAIDALTDAYEAERRQIDVNIDASRNRYDAELDAVDAVTAAIREKIRLEQAPAQAANTAAGNELAALEMERNRLELDWARRREAARAAGNIWELLRIDAEERAWDDAHKLRMETLRAEIQVSQDQMDVVADAYAAELAAVEAQKSAIQTRYDAEIAALQGLADAKRAAYDEERRRLEANQEYWADEIAAVRDIADAKRTVYEEERRRLELVQQGYDDEVERLQGLRRMTEERQESELQYWRDRQELLDRNYEANRRQVQQWIENTEAARQAAIEMDAGLQALKASMDEIQKSVAVLNWIQMVTGVMDWMSKAGVAIPQSFLNAINLIPRDTSTPLGALLDSIIESIQSAYGSGTSDYSSQFLPSFGEGGTVPGSWGEPQMIIAHGGEEVVPAGQQPQTVNNYNYNLTAQYRYQSERDVADDLRLLQLQQAGA